jgi:hypothetical protein
MNTLAHYAIAGTVSTIKFNFIAINSQVQMPYFKDYTGMHIYIW